MNIELRHLRYFLAVDRANNFSRAAEELNLSQPALSVQIKQLEKEVGARLFDRIGRRIYITEAGVLLRDYANRVLLELTEAEQSIGELHGLTKGDLTVGVLQTVNALLVPPTSSLFLLQYPGISLQVLELPGPEIVRKVASGELALGVSSVPTCDENIEEDVFFSEKLVLAISRKNKFANRKSISIDKLEGEPMVTFPKGYVTRQRIDHIFENANIKPTIVFETNTIGSILTATAQSGLLTIVPEMALRLKEGKDLIPLKIQGVESSRTVGFLWRRGAVKRKAATVFAKLMREVFAKTRK